MNDACDVPKELARFNEKVPRAVLLELLSPNESLNQAVATKSVEAEAILTLQLPFYSSQPRSPGSRHSKIAPYQLSNLAGAAENAGVVLFQPRLPWEVGQDDRREWLGRDTHCP